MTKSILSTLAAVALLSLVGCAAPSEEVSEDVDVKADLGVVETSATSAGLKKLPICGEPSETVKLDAATNETSDKLDEIAKVSSGVTCIPKVYTRRGAAMVCAPGLVPESGMCRAACREGYSMIDGACWLDGCPKGFRDDGILCEKPAPSPECRKVAKGEGCDVECPKGMADVGDACRKSGYVQNANNTKPIGFVPLLHTPVFAVPASTCPANRPERLGDLCYAPCLPGFNAANAVCFWSGK